ncbi:N-acetylglucosamine-6-phosphate deacetylase [Microlunatus endophyticus]|uniref:N-acetylglucosamine-6-phosphate deacetylase n=1 Tax=Microlunatus endophyticus TaxID=1716077 RepID=A0A917W2T3_9ACTN|nr:amidohydrolase family protein [Microlunatus endophyticus]GGL55261.1 N-acetylglucosamine-6-phosphate deacetylase [Microlunatus endophyticus]
MTQIATIEGRVPGGPAVRVTIEGELITHIEPLSYDPGQLVLPGLVDCQINGFAGADVNAEDISVEVVGALTRSLVAEGTTTYCPTIISGSPDRIRRALGVIRSACEQDPMVARCVAGIHVEGPSISAEDGARGAHAAEWLRDPDPAELADWLEVSGGLLRIVTLGPERPGSIEYIRAATAAGVLVSLGHTAATPAQVHRAAAAGATLSTHLGNGAHPQLPRHPNYLWAQLADDRLTAGLITDGHHLDADTVTAMIRAKGPGRTLLVSDAAALAHCPPGDYATPVGGSVTVDPDGALRLTGTALNAGSGSSLLDCLSWAMAQTPFEPADLLAMATSIPAGILGLSDRGGLEPGARADLLVTDADLRPLQVVIAGRTMGNPPGCA